MGSKGTRVFPGGRRVEGDCPAFVNLDWTESDADDHRTLVLALQGPGRSVPLMWKTVVKSTIQGSRNDDEDDLLGAFSKAVPVGVEVTIVADRDFCDPRRLQFIEKNLSFDDIIRTHKGITVQGVRGRPPPARRVLESPRSR